MSFEEILPYVFAAGVLGLCFIPILAGISDYKLSKMEKAKKKKKHV